MDKLKQYLVEWTKPLHQDVYDEVEMLLKQLESCVNDNSITHTELAKVKELYKEATEQQKYVAPIDQYLTAKYQLIPNKAYKNKRGKGSQTVWLNQMITPQAWEVQNFKQAVVKQPGNSWVDIVSLGEALAKHTTWVDEQKLYDTGDYYLYPEETLTTNKKKCDCEDVSYTMTSFMPQLMGVCYGYFIQSEKVKFGHAFPVFLYKGKLYILETTGDRVEVAPFNDKRYDAYFIVTQQYTYQLKSGLEFGVLASWDLKNN